jgi:hypothetical protein
MEELENQRDIKMYPNAEEIYLHIKYIHYELEKHNIKHWLMYGTLLGCIRNKDVIPYDYDFDFGILFSDIDKILSIELENKKYRIGKTKGGTIYSKKSQFKDVEGIWRVSLKVMYEEIPVGDLYIYYRFDDGYMQRYDPINKILFWPMSVYPAMLTDNLEYGNIRDLKLPIPKYPECLLEYFYGPMWKVPIQANSQGGPGHQDYDYYASYKYSSLIELIKRVKEEVLKKENKNIELDLPKLTYDDIDYIFPKEQVEWLKDNENLNFKKYFKNIKKEKRKKE